MKHYRFQKLVYLLFIFLLTATHSTSAMVLPSTTLTIPSIEVDESGTRYQWLTDYTGPKYWDVPPSNPLVVTGTEGSELIPGPEDTVRLIITLNAPSIAEYLLTLRADLPDLERQSLINAYAQTLEHQQTDFIDELINLDISVTEIVRHKFLTNSLTVLTNAANTMKLSKLRTVVDVSPDYELKSEVIDSVPLIGAPEVWSLSTPSGVNITGVDKIVAVIDSGIDYSHPDLGGCLGTGCKVIGGYDFINLDSDPMDDFGHGTHVAGIIAANGVLTGVAPDAYLLAYKVINENGVGYASDVISAIEQAVMDNAEVINISLGGPGNPDDPLCSAVDMASQLGVVVVAAAGNRGPNYATIDSPGLARSAITVGSSTKSDTISSFSSRGPVTTLTATVKPDLIAPGQSIYSTTSLIGTLGSSTRYRTLSGTSMASPHVAGAAALLRQYRPSWSTGMIKAALMNLTVDKNINHYIQGAGRLDLSNLSNMDTLIKPNLIDFGIDDLNASQWASSNSFIVTNWQSNTRDFVISVQTPLSAGITLNITPDQFSLAAGQSQQINLSLEVNNLSLPNFSDPPYSYINALLMSDGSTTRKIPFSFVKMSILDLEFNSDPWVVIIHNRMDLIKSSSFNYHPILFLPEGNYDIMVQFLDGKSRMVRENVPVETLTHLVFDLTDADHQVDLVMRDINGEIIPFEGLYMDQRMPTSLILKDSDFGLYSLGRSCIEEMICDNLHFSDVSDDYSFEIAIPAQSLATDDIYYRFHHQLSDGINADMVLENDPAQLKPILFDTPAPSSSEAMTLVRWIGTKDVLTTDQSAYRTMTYPYQEQAYYQPVTADAVVKYEMLSFFEGFSIPSAPFPGQYQTPLFYAADPLTLNFLATNNPQVLLGENQNAVWRINQSPPHWVGELAMDESQIWLTSLVGANTLFASQSQDFKPHGSLSYGLAKDGTVYLYGVVSANQALPLQEPGEYALQIAYTGYALGVMDGTAQVELAFDTTKIDSIPPRLTSLVIKDDQAYYDVQPAATVLTLVIEYYDESAISSVGMYYRNEESWIEMSPVIADNRAEVELPDFEAYQYIDFKFMLTDSYGNRLTFQLEPGLLIEGNYILNFPIVFGP